MSDKSVSESTADAVASSAVGGDWVRLLDALRDYDEVVWLAHREHRDHTEDLSVIYRADIEALNDKYTTEVTISQTEWRIAHMAARHDYLAVLESLRPASTTGGSAASEVLPSSPEKAS